MTDDNARKLERVRAAINATKADGVYQSATPFIDLLAQLDAALDDRCPLCGAAAGRTEATCPESFRYGVGAQAVVLSAQVVVVTCAACRGSWTDARGEDARSEAVTRHLQRRVSELEAALTVLSAHDVRNGLGWQARAERAEQVVAAARAALTRCTCMCKHVGAAKVALADPTSVPPVGETT